MTLEDARAMRACAMREWSSSNGYFSTLADALNRTNYIKGFPPTKVMLVWRGELSLEVKMNYPTLDAVNAASHLQICRWWRFLKSPGLVAVGRADFEEVSEREVIVMNRIAERLKEFNGFTPEISKAIGWG